MNQRIRGSLERVSMRNQVRNTISPLPFELSWLVSPFFTRAISSEEIIADDMYTKFLKKKGNNRKKQKEARDAIFSERAKKVSVLIIRTLFLTPSDICSCVYIIIRQRHRQVIWRYVIFSICPAKAIHVSFHSLFSGRDMGNKRRYVAVVVFVHGRLTTHYLMLLSFFCSRNSQGHPSQNPSSSARKPHNATMFAKHPCALAAESTLSCTSAISGKCQRQ